MPLLTTKLHIPAPRPDLVPRPHLIKRLDAGLQGKFTLISAPAGYGKSTLVSEWIARAKIPVAWLSLDASENDITQFFIYLIAALQQINPNIGVDVQSILDAGADPPIENLLTALVNDITASAPRFALVMDDYHLIQEIKVHQAIDFLFDHFPPGMHMVILSRIDPPMSLGRLRVQQELTEIREADLRFTHDEVAAFLNQKMGLALSNQDIQNLETRTEGWIAGLQLAALTLRGRPDKHDLIADFSGSHRHLIDYLVHEVLSQQPDNVQMFLLCTSILERFNASLCNALTQQISGREMLIFLEKANLFLISTDNERQWYRYHQLFADFLQQRLRESQPEIVPELFIRASQWYEAQSMMEAAIDHAFTGGDENRAARLLDEYAETLLITNSDVNQMLRWANKLPVEARAQFTRLCIYHAWALQFEYQLESVEPTLALVEAHLNDPTRLPESFPPAVITGHINTIRAYTATKRGEFERSVNLSLATLEGLPDEDTKDVLLLRGVTMLGLGMGYFNLGQMEAAYQAYQTALPLNQQIGNRYAALSCIHYMMFVDIDRGTLNRALANGEMGLLWIEEWSGLEGRQGRPARMLAHLRWNVGRVLYERDELDKAAEYLYKAAEYYEFVGSWHRIRGYAYLVDLNLALGEIEVALRYFRKLKHISLIPGISLSDIPVAAMVAERNLNLSQHRPELDNLFTEAIEWAESSGLKPDEKIRYYEQEYEFLILARVWIAQGKREEAIHLLDRLIISAEDSGLNGELIAVLSLQAIALYKLGKIDVAYKCISRALEFGEPEGYVRTFVDLGSPMQDLLGIVAQRGSAPNYINKLLAAFPTATVQPARLEIRELIEPLSDRETQILRLLSARYTYREISEELYLSLNTVKWYTKNIYNKLGVSKKSQAAARARELGLL